MFQTWTFHGSTLPTPIPKRNARTGLLFTGPAALCATAASSSFLRFPSVCCAAFCNSPQISGLLLALGWESGRGGSSRFLPFSLLWHACAVRLSSAAFCAVAVSCRSLPAVRLSSAALCATAASGVFLRSPSVCCATFLRLSILAPSAAWGGSWARGFLAAGLGVSGGSGGMNQGIRAWACCREDARVPGRGHRL